MKIYILLDILLCSIAEYFLPWMRVVLLAALRLVFAALPLNSVAPNEKKKPLVPG